MALMVYGMLTCAHLTHLHTRGYRPHVHRHIRTPVHTRTRSYTHSQRRIHTHVLHPIGTRTRATMYICTRTNTHIGKQSHADVQIHLYAYHCTHLHGIHVRTCVCEYYCHRSHTYTTVTRMCTHGFCQWYTVTYHNVHVHS